MIEKLASTAIVFQLAGVGLNQQMLPVFLGLMLVAAIAWSGYENDGATQGLDQQ